MEGLKAHFQNGAFRKRYDKMPGSRTRLHTTILLLGCRRF